MKHLVYTGNASLDRFITTSHKVEDVLLVALLWALSIVVMIQVISRYVFSSSIPWTEEVARLMLIYATFFGAFLTSRSKSYISIDLISRFFKGQKRLLFILRNLIMAVFYTWLAYLACDVADKTWHQELTTLLITNGVTYVIPAIGLVLLAFRSASQIVLTLLFPAFSVEPSYMEEMF